MFEKRKRMYSFGLTGPRYHSPDVFAPEKKSSVQWLSQSAIGQTISPPLAMCELKKTDYL